MAWADGVLVYVLSGSAVQVLERDTWPNSLSDLESWLGTVELQEQESGQETWESVVPPDLHSKQRSSPANFVRGVTPSREEGTCL